MVVKMSLILREIHSLRVFENRVLGKEIGPKRQERTEGSIICMLRIILLEGSPQGW